VAFVDNCLFSARGAKKLFNRKLKKTLQEQSAELHLLRQQVEQMDRGMLSIRLDAQFRICAVNRFFLETLGYSGDHLHDRPLSEIVPPYVKNLPCFHAFNQAVARFEPVSDEYRYLRADGTLAWLKIYWLPIRNQDGSLAHVQGYGSEITRTVEESKENQALIEALARSVRHKKRDPMSTSISGRRLTVGNMWRIGSSEWTGVGTIFG